MALATEIITADDLLHMPSDDMRHELVKGELRTMPPAAYEHGITTMSLGRRLANHVADNHLGDIAAAETGFILATDPDTVRAPDIAFVRADRIPASGRPRTYWKGPPDLAVEVLSPGDSLKEAGEKVDDYLHAGTPMVWLVNPRRKSVTVYRPGVESLVLHENDTLEGFDVVTGFQCPVRDIFI